MKKTIVLLLTVIMLFELCCCAFAASEPLEFVIPRHIIVPPSIKDATKATMLVPIESNYSDQLSGPFPDKEKRWDSWNISYENGKIVIMLSKRTADNKFDYSFFLSVENSEETVLEYQGTMMGGYRGLDHFSYTFNADGTVTRNNCMKYNPFKYYIYDFADENGWYTFVDDKQKYVKLNLEPTTDLIPPIKFTFTDETLELWKKP
ncbi:MAG: hypothetical protein IKH30_01730 [Clostridia bacterium]|nr:hypothetical protein [Clostridia bacterium]